MHAIHVCMVYISICMCVRTYVCTYVCVYVRMYVCTYVSKKCSKNGPFRLRCTRQLFPKNGINGPFRSTVSSILYFC